MARAFTTEFSYKGSKHTAVITEISNSTTIYLPDESFHALLPKGKITFDPRKGIPVDSPRLKPAQELIISVLGSVAAQYQNTHGPNDNDHTHQQSRHSSH